MLKSVKCELLIDFHRLSGFFLQPRCAKGGGKAFPTGIVHEMRWLKFVEIDFCGKNAITDIFYNPYAGKAGNPVAMRCNIT